MPKCKPAKNEQGKVYIVPDGWKFTPLITAREMHMDSYMISKIREMFKHVDDGDITAPSAYQLLEYQIELIEEILQEQPVRYK